MKKLKIIFLILLGVVCTQLFAVQPNSIYSQKPNVQKLSILLLKIIR